MLVSVFFFFSEYKIGFLHNVLSFSSISTHSSVNENAYQHEEVAEEEHEEVGDDISQEEKKTLILGRGPTRKNTKTLTNNLDDKDTEKWQIFTVDCFLILIFL